MNLEDRISALERGLQAAAAEQERNTEVLNAELDSLEQQVTNFRELVQLLKRRHHA